MDFTSLFNMQGMMFCILALGWYLRKSGMIDKSGKALLSSLVMNVTLPASIVKSFQMEFSMNILKLTLEVIVISFLIQIFSNLLSRVLYPGWSEESKKVLQYATIVSNAGILGNAIAEGIFGDLGIMYAAVYTIPTRIFMWSVGLTYFTEAPTKKELLKKVETKEKNWKEAVKEAQDDFDEDIINTLLIIGRSRSKETDHYKDALKLLKARISNLESNLHIEIDMERIEDRSKALSYIGLEIADALKEIPAPAEEVVEEQVEPIVEPIQKAKKVKAKKEKKVNVAAIAEHSNVEKVEQPKVETIQKVEEPQQEQYVTETFEAKPSLWQRFKNSKFVRTIKYIMSIRVVLEVPALPEGKTEN